MAPNQWQINTGIHSRGLFPQPGMALDTTDFSCIVMVSLVSWIWFQKFTFQDYFGFEEEPEVALFTVSDAVNKKGEDIV